MSQASMQFAPQWLKKPAPSSAHPAQTQAQALRSASPPLPSPRTVTPPAINIGGLSYSHMANPSSARSESFPSDGGSGSPYAVNGNGIVMDEHRPFRYSKEAMLALYDPSLVRNRPLELLELGETGAVILSAKPNGPVGFTEMSEEEKKIYNSSLNPPMRQRPAHPPTTTADATHGHAHSHSAASTPYLRRGPNTSISGTAAITGAGAIGRGTIGGGFGRGEGGAFGGKVAAGQEGRERDGEVRERDSGYLNRDRSDRVERGERGYDGRDRERYAAGTPGRGPGGAPYVGAVDGEDRRGGPLRRGAGPARAGDAADVAAPGPRAGNTAATWRPSIRNNSVSGASFEGVLGFGGGNAGSGAPAAEQPQRSYPAGVDSPGSGASGGWRERERAAAERERFANAIPAAPTSSAQDRLGAAGVMPLAGGGSGWSKGGGRWRQAAQVDQGHVAPPGDTSGEPASGAESATQAASVAPGPSETPVEERLEQLRVDEQDAGRAPNQPQPASQSIDPESVQWFYTDPQGLQQGPFTATQMQDWYSHGYFVDTLPLRRDHESDHRTLAAVKAETGDLIRPFLTRPLPSRQATPPAPVQTSAPPQLTQAPYSNAGFVNGMNGQPFQQQPIAQPHFDTFSQMVQPLQQRSVWDNPALQARQSPYLANVAPIGSPFGQQGVPGYFGNVNQAMGASQGLPMPQAPFQAVSPWGMPQQAPQMMPQQDTIHGGTAPVYQQMLSQVAAPNSETHQSNATPDAPQQQQSHPWSSQAEAQSSSAPPAQAEEVAVPAPAPAEATPTTPPQPAEAEPTSSRIAKATEALPASPKAPVAVAQGEEQTQAALPAKPATPATKSSALPPPPASLPAKPPAASTSAAAASSPAKSAPLEPKAAATPDVKQRKSTKEVVEPARVSSPVPKVAPWASKEDDKTRTPTGPSLREIQEAEAKQAEARKQAEAKAKATAAAAAQISSTPQGEGDALNGMSWGLPSKPSAGPAATPPVSGPSTPVWGQGEAAAKKTLKQIQEEEEKRAKAQAAAKAAASGGASVPTRRGYADLAAGPTQAAAGWSTVGSGGKTTPAAAQPARAAAAVPAKPLASLLKPATPTPSPAKTTKASPATLNEVTPTADFIRWTKESLKGLTNVNMDEFVQMLLTFPVEPAAAERQSTLEIISDSVYANSSTLDGRRFAQEFYAKRKTDAQAQLAAAANGKPITASSSLADVVKAQPKAVNNDFGAFKIVKSKGKGRK